MEFKLVRASGSKGLGDLLKAQNATIIDFTGRDQLGDPLNDLLKKGAEKLLGAAIEAEVEALLDGLKGRRTADDRAGVVRNGYHPERAVQTGIGPVKVKIPKVRAKTGAPVTFRSALVPPYVRKTQTLEAAIPWLYLKGISTGEMGPALKALLGPKATGFSAKTVARLKAQWATEYDTWRKSDLGREEWVYIWAPSRRGNPPAGQWMASTAVSGVKITSSVRLS